MWSKGREGHWGRLIVDGRTRGLSLIEAREGGRERNWVESGTWESGALCLTR